MDKGSEREGGAPPGAEGKASSAGIDRAFSTKKKKKKKKTTTKLDLHAILGQACPNLKISSSALKAMSTMATSVAGEVATNEAVQEEVLTRVVANSTHSLSWLTRPTNIDEGAVIGSFTRCAGKTEMADQDYKYWGGADLPWRNGVDDTPVLDQGVIASEEQHKLTAEASDQATSGTPAHADKLRRCGVRIDFLLALTFALDMWEWKTWEVVQYLVKPATENEGRCRFAELASMREYVGAATVFMSHCWGGRWGDLVVATCAGADKKRFVWIDVFAVRQWPGNGADLDFRGVLTGCTAAIVTCAPIEGTLLKDGEEGMSDFKSREAFLRSDEYAAAAKVLPFCRLWCVVEIAAVLTLEKPLMFACGKAGGVFKDRGETRLRVERGIEAVQMLTNCSLLVDVAAAQCAVPADKERELAAIGPANFARINRIVAAALQAGAIAVEANIFEVDSFNCGEASKLDFLPSSRVGKAFIVACSAGQLAVLVELRRARPKSVAAYLAGEEGDGKGGWHPVWEASMNGHCGVVEWLLGEVGATAEAVNPDTGTNAVLMAAQNGHLEVLLVLVKAGASMDRGTMPMGRGITPIFAAAQHGHLEVVRMLVEAGADISICMMGNGWSPLLVAAWSGHAAVVAELLQHGADRLIATAQEHLNIPAGSTALSVAQLKGYQDVVGLLSHGKKFAVVGLSSANGRLIWMAVGVAACCAILALALGKSKRTGP